MTDNLQKILSEMPQVKEIFRKTNGVDGFSVKLEDGEVIDISGSKWRYANKIWVNDFLSFGTTKGKEIVFSKEQANKAEQFS